MSKSSNKKISKSEESQKEDFLDLDRELKDLIKKNESIKTGMTKLFNEIEKKNNTNKSNN